MIKTSITIKFYLTHFNKSLFVQKSEQEKLEIFEKNYSDDDTSANSISADNSFKNIDSDSQNVFETMKIPDNDENKNASNSIHIEKKNRLINLNEKRI